MIFCCLFACLFVCLSSDVTGVYCLRILKETGENIYCSLIELFAELYKRLENTKIDPVYGLVWFYGILGYLMPNPLYTYILNIYDLLLVLWHIDHCRWFTVKSSLYTYIKYIWFGLVWFGLVLWHSNRCWLFNVKSSLHIYIKYIWFGLVVFYGISTSVGYLCQILFIHIY